MKLGHALFTFCLLASQAAFAAPDAGDHGASGGLPQLDPSTFSSQIFWMFVFFIILYVILSSVALPRIGSVLETRRLKVNSDLDQARSLHDEALKIKESYEETLAQAHNKIRDLMAANQALMSRQSMEQNQELTEKLSAQIADAEANIEKARSKALKDIQEASTVVALEIANKFASIAVNDNDAASAVKEQVKKTV